jgi:hypothetical protein
MRFVLFVEGDTERDVLPNLLKRCLEERTLQPVGIRAVNFNGWSNLWRDVRQKADFYLRGAGKSPDIVAVVSLMDLYGPDIYPAHLNSAKERLEWAKSRLEKEVVRHERFRQYFAVHELEAWLFSQPDIFPAEIRKEIHALSTNPEGVNFDAPPKKRLHSIYDHRLKRRYQPRVDGAKLFRKLAPQALKSKCPIFTAMIEELAALAQNVA